VLQRWASGAGWPTVAGVESARTAHVRGWLARKQGHDKSDDKAFQNTTKAHAAAVAGMALQCGTDQAHGVRPAVEGACLAYLRTGSAYPPGVTAASGDGDGPDGWVANSTLLDTDTGAWHMHYASTPFKSFFPLDLGGMAEALLDKPHGVVKACEFTV
jgi:hypothetical protein